MSEIPHVAVYEVRTCKGRQGDRGMNPGLFLAQSLEARFRGRLSYDPRKYRVAHGGR